MSEICAGNDYTSSDTEEKPSVEKCELAKDLRMREKIDSIDVRIHH